MQIRLTQKPLEEVVAAIQALDLESVKCRLMDPDIGEGWSRDYADHIEAAYKRYLVVQVKYPEHAEDILLAKDVDEFWHTHILQTLKYFADCQTVFGNYLHHTPHVGEITQAVQDQRDRQAQITRAVYEAEFGGTEGAGAAWTGMASGVTRAAPGENDIRPSDAAYSGSAIQAGRAAYSGSAIQAETAAYSGSAIQAGSAAYSGSAIQAGRAAYSGSAIKAGSAAYSGSAIQARSAAYSGSAIQAGNAAYSGSAIKAGSAAYSGSAIQAGNAAYSGSAIKAADAAYSGSAIKAESVTPVENRA